MPNHDNYVLNSSLNEGYPTPYKDLVLRNLKDTLIITYPLAKIMRDFTFTNGLNQGYLHRLYVEPLMHIDPATGRETSRCIQKAPFPKLMYMVGDDTKTDMYPDGINQGYPCTYTKTNLRRGVQDFPFPKLMFMSGAYSSTDKYSDGCNQGYPCTFYRTDIRRGVQDRPFPRLMPSFEEDNDWYLSFRKNCIGFGAASNIPTLDEIEIPRSVRYIADYAFYNTNIKKVKMHPECLYFRHSFPRGTMIAFYPPDK